MHDITRFAAALAFAMLSLSPQAGAAHSCDGVLPPPDHTVAIRPLVAEDLVKLRDVGVHDLAYPEANSIAVSPDETQLAFQIRQAIPQTNSYCTAIVVIGLRTRTSPIVIDKGGTLLRNSFEFRGKADFPTGTARAISPKWSGDGRWIAFLKRTELGTQVWRANVTGEHSEPLTHGPIDVDDFEFTQDKRSIIFSSRPALTAAKRALEKEALVGLHFDDRFSPMSRSLPFPAAPISSLVQTLDIETGAVRLARPEEKAVLERTAGAPEGAQRYARSSSGQRAWTTTDNRPGPYGRVQLSADDASGKTHVCARCGSQIIRIWWRDDNKAVQFLQREGWGLQATGLYEWRPESAGPTRLLVTNDILADCTSADRSIICLREGSSQPRKIEMLSVGSAAFKTIFDPNPEFRQLRVGAVERLLWKNAEGIETFGDLVLPVGYKKGTRYPLIVVQYESRGFLRGGTGDEYPIQAFANRGYAVLSINRPRHIGVLRGQPDGLSIDRENLKDFADRRSVQSSIETGVKSLIDKGLIDPARIGITGLSDGASSVQFALIHSRLFSAAAMSSPTWDPAYYAAVGPAATEEFKATGYPGPLDYLAPFWDVVSIARNARAISVPILMQLPDDEYMAGLEGFSALKEAGTPVDLFVFSGEHHIKWQPAHRLAIYRRALDWFDFWLSGRTSTDPDRLPDIQRWSMLKHKPGDVSMKP